MARHASSPSSHDRGGKGVYRNRANASFARDGMTLFVRIARPYKAGGKRMVTSWPFLCTFDRAQYNALRDDIEPPAPVVQTKPVEREQMVDVLCWCQSRTVRVRAAEVAKGRTASCTDEHCYDRYREIRESNQGSNR